MTPPLHTMTIFRHINLSSSKTPEAMQSIIHFLMSMSLFIRLLFTYKSPLREQAQPPIVIESNMLLSSQERAQLATSRARLFVSSAAVNQAVESAAEESPRTPIPSPVKVAPSPSPSLPPSSSPAPSPAKSKPYMSPFSFSAIFLSAYALSVLHQSQKSKHRQVPRSY